MTPQCIGIIMDGNRRWAKSHGFSTYEGHKKGYEKLKDVVGWAKEAGTHSLIVYAFSTENWNRTKEEVSYLMDLFRTVLKDEVHVLAGEFTRVRFLGTKHRFSPDIRTMMEEVEEKTKTETKFTLGVALSYGGRAEILAAAEALCSMENSQKEITEENFSKYLWTAGMSDPDIIIRTGGERRLSNFLPWQSVYTELFFVDTLWPDFSKEEFEEILKEFSERERRRGH
ncbi:MAG: di-trans,poly-cis-decaprenylcistransferase [Parcubacteria group bacterium]|nr:di-trans,poly-cis-decaprenylcistransferase [Parcubacteria group bacterium]